MHNPDSDSSHTTSKSVDQRNLDSMDNGCEIRLLLPAITWTQKPYSCFEDSFVDVFLLKYTLTQVQVIKYFTDIKKIHTVTSFLLEISAPTWQNLHMEITKDI